MDLIIFFTIEFQIMEDRCIPMIYDVGNFLFKLIL